MGGPRSLLSSPTGLRLTTTFFIETWTSNVAKFDMTKEACDAFRDDLANVKLRRPELYNPTLDPDVKDIRTRDRKVVFHDLTIDDLAFDGIGLTFEVIKQADDEDEE